MVSGLVENADACTALEGTSGTSPDPEKARAGDIALNAGTFSLTGGARVDSGTTGSGKGGTVEVTTTSPSRRPFTLKGDYSGGLAAKNDPWSAPPAPQMSKSPTV